MAACLHTVVVVPEPIYIYTIHSVQCIWKSLVLFLVFILLPSSCFFKSFGDATGLFSFLFNSHMRDGVLTCQVCMCDKFSNQLIPADTLGSRAICPQSPLTQSFRSKTDSLRFPLLHTNRSSQSMSNRFYVSNVNCT